MREVSYEALHKATQSYQSTLAWYQAVSDSPNVERDRDAAFAAFKHHVRHRGADVTTDLLDELEGAKSQLNERHKYCEGVVPDESKRVAELEAREVQLPTHCDLRYGHPINVDEQHVMIPKGSGS